MNNNRHGGMGNFNVNSSTGRNMETPQSFPQASSPSVGDIIKAVASKIIERMAKSFAITFPMNYYNPENSDSFDIRALDIYSAGEDKILMSYTAQEGQTIRFIKYGFFTNIVLADNVRMWPEINGVRILKYHGDPNQDFAINLSLGPDLTENSMIPTDFELAPGQTLTIRAKNTSGTTAEIGARFRGYIMKASRNDRAFGG